MSEQWFDRVGIALKDAERFSLEFWLYDEYPYPSGVGGGEATLAHPEFKAETLEQKFIIGETPRCIDRSHNEELKERILDLIDENYNDANLGLTFIAEHVGMNPSYLSHFFKEQIGYSIVDHINKVRIGHAKELLRSDEPLAVIAQKIGYSSDDALVKTFKRYEVITPG